MNCYLPFFHFSRLFLQRVPICFVQYSHLRLDPPRSSSSVGWKCGLLVFNTFLHSGLILQYLVTAMQFRCFDLEIIFSILDARVVVLYIYATVIFLRFLFEFFHCSRHFSFLISGVVITHTCFRKCRFQTGSGTLSTIILTCVNLPHTAPREYSAAKYHKAMNEFYSNLFL